MPIYDPFEQRMAVRVVYDGVACAGKTTNLRQLCTLFLAQRTTELYSPGDMHGRTLFFDWMQIQAGVVSGFPLLCQVVSVPGQVVLTPRRKHLLATADVVVYVCESHEGAMRSARSGLELYDLVAKERGVPIPLVIQANKQDQVDAFDGPALLRALGREGVPVVEGIASEGVGVVDTFVTAVRTVVRAIQARTEVDELHVPVRRADTAEAVLSRLLEEELAPEWAAEMLLEEAQAAFLVEEAMAVVATDPEARAAAAAAAEELSHIDMTPPPVVDETAAAPSAPVASLTAPPILPRHDVPTGFIWPAHTGRATVRSLAMTGLEANALDAEGRVVHVAHGYVASTSTRARFGDGEAARQALVKSARECTQLDRLLAPETVLVAQTVTDGSCWIWTVRPDLPSIERLLGARQTSPELLGAYGVAVVEALRTSLRHGFSVRFSPDAFGVQQGVLRYIGELSPELPRAADVSSSIFAAVDAIERAGADVGTFLDAFERELQRRLTPEERARATASMSGPPPSDGAGTRTAGERLYAVLSRAHEAS